MSDERYTRRTLLRSCAGATGFVALGSLAGCSGGDGDGSDGTTTTGGDTTPTSTPTPTPGSGPGAGGSADVPAGAEAIIEIDMQGMIDDQNLRSVANTFLAEAAKQEGYTGPTTVEDALDLGQTAGDVDPEGFNSMTLYMKVDGATAVESYTGMMLHTDLTAEELLDSAEGMGTDLTESSYQGVTTYESEGDDGLFAVLGDGTFVAGTETAVKDAIDVSTGNAQPASGEVATHFSNTTDGHFRFASLVPEDQLPDDSAEINIPALQELRYVSGSFFSQSSNLGININMHTTSSESAADLADDFDALLSTAGMRVEDPDVQQVIDQVEFSASGSTATMAYVESVTQINTYVQQYASQFFGMGVGTGVGSSV